VVTGRKNWQGQKMRHGLPGKEIKQEKLREDVKFRVRPGKKENGGYAE